MVDVVVAAAALLPDPEHFLDPDAQQKTGRACSDPTAVLKLTTPTVQSVH